MGVTILETSKLVKIYGDAGSDGATTAIDGVNLSISQGEFIAIMGPSGSGKTTLLHMMSGIDAPTSGEVYIAGKEIGEMNGDELALFRRKQLGFVFQEFNLLDSLTVKENMLVPMVLEKKSVAEMEGKVKELSELFGIENILNNYPFAISGGQQQRTAVGRALVNDPTIIFADEPTGNLDSKSSTVIMECFEKIVKELSTTVVVVTHDVFAASYCRKVVFIKDGKIDSYIVRKGDRKEFLNQIMDNLALLGGRSHDI
ncbi:multidrug ABC transporter ATP-binding protein [Sutcliffiella horikoshii]|uniref:ABC transporter ATP-binding protein n=1 Tax=Sutcliffiella horikoshii TaxID=79883 RepID=A0A1Y0CP15_9BACI|nr:ABC transporter ATP-binding protein [Sutcliffiella horikoshii]ART77020.1 multidrug ABC transporter ATP-binding protein [Sutcliffiella horikoshii]TYS55912.1 ABC transporter ATP-binding protein [Sutcliffiella horikoshii]TYS74426.1 ABC transporter ATP-binding protein [Sutcliffiella horikoshii]